MCAQSVIARHGRSANLLIRVAGVATLLQLVLFYRFFIDDAFISLRYARNLVLGNGLVFNLGERVEGYSNLLWVLLLAGLHAVGVDLAIAVKLLGLVGIVALLIGAYWLVCHLSDGDALYAGGIVVLLASSFGVVFFGITGLETIFFSALLVGATCFFAISNSFSLPAVLLLYGAALTRPEGVVYFGAGLVVASWSFGTAGMRWRWPVLFVLLYAALLLWRHGYYGEWLPNTFYAKPPTDEGALPAIVPALTEVYRFMLANGGALLFALAVTGVYMERSSATVRLLTAFVLLGLGFQLYSGGDWTLAGRFLVPVLPFYLTVAMLGLRRVLNALASSGPFSVPHVPVASGLFLLLAACNLIESGTFYLNRGAYPNFVMTSEDLIPASQWIGAHYPPQYAVVSWRTGALAYYSGLTVIDATYGLTDRVVAHHRFGGTWTPEVRQAYLAERNPELIMYGGNIGTTPEPSITSGGRRYDFVRRFPQGTYQEWYLYQRADLDRRPEEPAP